MSHSPELDHLAARWAEAPDGTAFAALADGLRKAGALAEAEAVALAPLAVISLVGLALMPFLPGELALWIGVAVVVNAAGAIGDLWMTSVALHFDPSALIQDLEDGMRIFVQAGGVRQSE